MGDKKPTPQKPEGGPKDQVSLTFEMLLANRKYSQHLTKNEYLGGPETRDVYQRPAQHVPPHHHAGYKLVVQA